MESMVSIIIAVSAILLLLLVFRFLGRKRVSEQEHKNTNVQHNQANEFDQSNVTVEHHSTLDIMLLERVNNNRFFEWDAVLRGSTIALFPTRTGDPEIDIAMMGVENSFIPTEEQMSEFRSREGTRPQIEGITFSFRIDPIPPPVQLSNEWGVS